MKSCTIYKTKKQFKIITQSRTQAGYLLSGEPIFILDIDCDISLFQHAIFEALNQSKNDISTPEPEKMLGYQKDLLAKIKEKSFSNLYKSSNSCEIRIENEVLEIHPNTYFDRNKPQQGLVWVKNIAFEYKLPSASKEEIASKVLELLQTDYKNIESFKSI